MATTNSLADHSTLEDRTIRKVSRRIIPFLIILYFLSFLNRVNVAFAGLTMNQLIRMTPCQLEQLYAQGIMTPIPPGKIRGQALLNPGTKLAVPTSRGSRLVWQGKILSADGQTAVNRFFGLRMIKANVYCAESWRDGRPALILDYKETSLLYATYRDEIRQLQAA